MATKIQPFQIDLTDPSGNGPVTQNYILSNFVELSGDTMTGNLIVNADTTTNNLTVLGTLDMGTF